MSEKRSRNIEFVKTAIGLAATAAAIAKPDFQALRFAPTILAMLVTVGFRVPLSRKRAKRIIKAALNNPEVSLQEIAFKVRTHPDRETMDREVRELLREMENALDSDVLELLFRVLQYRAVERLPQRLAQQIVRLLKALSIQELESLRYLLQDAVAVGEASDIDVVSWAEIDGLNEPTTAVRVNDELVPIRNCLDSRRIWLALEQADLAAEVIIWGGPSATSTTYERFPRPQRRIQIRNDVAKAIQLVLK